MPWQSANTAKLALFFPHSSYWKHLFHRIKVTMATCCKINPRRWQQFSALQFISTSKHLLHAPYYLFNHPSNSAFLEYFILIPFCVHVCDEGVFREWMWRSENNMQESLSLHCMGSRDHTQERKLAQQAFVPTEPSHSNVCCLTCIVPISVSILNICLTTCHFPFPTSHCYWRNRKPTAIPRWAGLFSPRSICSL